MQPTRRGRTIVIGIVIAVVLAFIGVVAVTRNVDSESLPTPTRSFCAAAREYDDKLPSGKLSLGRQIVLVGRMADHAPRDIRREAHRFLTSLQRLRDGDESVKGDPSVEEAVEAVNRRAANGCDFYQRDPGGL